MYLLQSVINIILMYFIYCILVSRPIAYFICIILLPLFECIHHCCCLCVLFSPPICTRDRHSSKGGGIQWLWRHPSLQTPKPRRKQSHPDAVELCGQKHCKTNFYLWTTIGCIYLPEPSDGQTLFKNLFPKWFFRGHQRGSDGWQRPVHLQWSLPQWCY